MALRSRSLTIPITMAENGPAPTRSEQARFGASEIQSSARGVISRVINWRHPRQEVRSAAGENMGRIVDVVVDPSGQVRAAVIDFGGFLGVGSPRIAVDWGA